MSLRLELGGRSDPGRARPDNQDAFAVDERGRWAVVSDGVGGRKAGQVASRLAVEVLAGHLARHLPRSLDLGAPGTFDRALGRLEQILGEWVRDANERLHAHAAQDPECEGMAATLSVLLVLEPYAVIAHVGDTRAYLLRRGGLVQITTDDAVLGSGIRPRSGAAGKAIRPDKRYVTQALGMAGDPVPAVNAQRLAPGDQVLLCTDGLTDMVDEEAIGRLLARSSSCDEALPALIAAANEAGGKDNITAVLLRVESGGVDPGSDIDRVESR